MLPWQPPSLVLSDSLCRSLSGARFNFEEEGEAGRSKVISVVDIPRGKCVPYDSESHNHREGFQKPVEKPTLGFLFACAPDHSPAVGTWAFPPLSAPRRPLLSCEVETWLVDQSDGRSEFSGALMERGDLGSSVDERQRHLDLRVRAGGQAGAVRACS